MNGTAVSARRADEIKAEWRLIRRGWLVQLSRLRTIPEGALAVLSPDERQFVEIIQSRGGVV